LHISTASVRIKNSYAYLYSICAYF